jgi:glyoxylase-like metal-dependent hydrolase (beta-lactamase superfamily II)
LDHEEAERVEELVDLELGRVTVLLGEKNGKYPHGNTVVVRGDEESLVIDPCLGLIPRQDRLPTVDRVVNSHCHEDHIAGNFLFPEVPWHFHELDAPGMRSLDDFMAIYGFDDEAVDRAFRPLVMNQFHFVPRANVETFRDGDVFDLGGCRMRVIHTPGHTRGHCAFHIEPDDVLYLGDIDLSSFGPYYGDAWADLEAFEDSMAKVREIDARHYVTFHHVGVLEGPEAFRERLDRFAAVIQQREARLLAFLRDPHTLEEVAEHRFVNRQGDPVPFVACVERRSMGQHIERLIREGRGRETEPGRFIAVSDRRSGTPS